MKYTDLPYFYKYLDLSGAVKTLSGCSVKFSRPIDFNDPFDLFIGEALGSDPEEFFKGLGLAFQDFLEGDIDYSKLPDNDFRAPIIMMHQALKNASPEIKQSIRQEVLEIREPLFDLKRLQTITDETIEKFKASLRTWGIFSATTKHDNLLMWAHYADKHTGVVLKFSPNISRDSVFRLLTPVEYSIKRPLMYREPVDMIKSAFSMPPDESAKEIMYRFIFSKSLEWGYEEEYRLAIPDLILESETMKTIRFFPEELSSVYLGCRMKEADRRVVIDMAKKVNPKVELYLSNISKREFSLNFETM